jgi:predicted RNA binding protein YcfA (HicA-like mRNA interferase family)
MPPKVSEILKMLGDDGWYVVTMRGSHRQLRHPSSLAESQFTASPVTT